MAVAVVDQKWCFPNALDLQCREVVKLLKDDNAEIKDAEGRTWFKIDARLIGIGDARTLIDAYNNPIVVMRKKLVAVRQAWVMSAGGREVATIKDTLISLRPEAHVFLADDGDRRADFIVKGNFRDKKFKVKKCEPGVDRVVATIRRQGLRGGLLRAMIDKDTYEIHIEPYVDVAFIVALVSLVDEMYHDQDGEDSD